MVACLHLACRPSPVRGQAAEAAIVLGRLGLLVGVISHACRLKLARALVGWGGGLVHAPTHGATGLAGRHQALEWRGVRGEAHHDSDRYVSS